MAPTGHTNDVTNAPGGGKRPTESQDWARLVLEYTSDLVTVLTPDGRALFQSPSIRRVLGYRPGDLPQGTVLDVVHHEDRPRMERALATLADHPQATVTDEFRLRHRDGSYRLFEGVAISLELPNGRRVIVVSSRDVTQARLVDATTGLPNARLLRYELDALRSTGAPDGTCRFSLVLLGIDRFRAWSTSLGPVDTNLIIADIGRRLSRAVEPPRFIAKLEGDRFAIVLRDQTDRTTALAAVRRMREALEAPFMLERGPLSVSAGAGIVVAPPSSMSPAEMLRAAELSLARAKARGPRREEVFHEGMGHQLVQGFELESALRRAMARGEMLLHYQPIVELRSECAVRAEALVRWSRAGEGLAPPETFIPVVENAGLACEFDMLVLESACRQLRDWRARDPALRGLLLSVNLSARSFENEELVQRIEQVLVRNEVPGDAIELEITETALMASTERTVKAMRALAQLRIGLGLDDFGTGYSSLSYLHAFPFNHLKVDRSFVRTLGRHEGKPQLVQAIVTMAHSLGLQTIAEGVETLEQLSFLREVGCEYAQGYVLATPMPPRDVEPLLMKPLSHGPRVAPPP